MAWTKNAAAGMLAGGMRIGASVTEPLLGALFKQYLGLPSRSTVTRRCKGHEDIISTDSTSTAEEKLAQEFGIDPIAPNGK